MHVPEPPASGTPQLRGDYSAAGADFAVEQAWGAHTPGQHSLWATLLERQLAMVKRYGAPQCLAGLTALEVKSVQ